jgi:hypothetical protein
MLLVLGLPGQPAAGERSSDAAKHLAIMKDSLARVQLRDADAPGDLYRLRTEPVLRFTNTVGQTRDGAIFVLLGDGARPGAAVQVFLKRDGSWIQEWTSLSPHLLTGEMDTEPDWKPARGGIEFKPVPGTPRPAVSAEQRLRQMHALTRDFSADDQFQGGSWQPLRLLPKPFARYGRPGSDLTDGALFAYVLTTDPEVFLMIEARPARDGLEWQYAFAPMSKYGLRGLCKGRVVWSVDFRLSRDPTGTFYQRWVEHPE